MLQSLFEQTIFQPDIGIPSEKNLFQVETRTFSNPEFDNLDSMLKCHCVYILENGSEAYIGETKNVIRRTKEHLSRSEKNGLKRYHFKRLHIITGRLAEIGFAKYQENQIKILMELDGKFNVVNRNDGEPQYCLRKNLFEWYFDKLWPKLVEKDLVNAKEYKLIINSTSYKYSPYTELTEQQQNSLNNIVNAIDFWENQKVEEPRPILVCGDAGTGKTVLATSLFYYLKKHTHYKDKKIALVYANPATRTEIGSIFKNTESLNKKDVISPIDVTKQHYDIIICDEAHKLRQGKNLGLYYNHFKEANKRMGMDNTHNELDWILKNSDYQVLLYDEKQHTSPCDIPHDYFEKKLLDNNRTVRLIALGDQMRIKAGNKYVGYIYDVLYQRAPQQQVFDEYEFKLFTSLPDMISCIDEKEHEAGLSRYCSGYAWPWRAKEDKDLVDISIDGVEIQWNTQTGGWLSNEEVKKEMGSIYTLPGLDLNYAGVVIGPDLYYDKVDNKIKVDKNHFFDNKVKKGISDTELKTYILNTYAVLFTRGIKGTYAYVCDDNLRAYFETYIPL